MRLLQISAQPHTAGNRIDLTFAHPNPAQFPGVRIVRREGTHPTSPLPASPRQGIVVADTNPAAAALSKIDVGADGLYRATDNSLKGETVYYYSLFPYSGSPPAYDIDLHNRIAAMATAPHAMAEQMAELLPPLYHRYDLAFPNPDAVASGDRNKGQLRRFLALPGGELDLVYSFARSILNLHDPDKVDGRLLPLLAQWIGWPTDFRLEMAAQRQEIRNAPHLYKTIGLIPTIEATVRRSLGVESRTKEFVHNVFRSNQPERLNLWMRQRNTGSATFPASAAPLSLDFAYEGRPALVRDGEGTLWLFYHTLRKGQWQIWCKTFLDNRGWSPSEPLTQGALADKHPTAALQKSTIWLFWTTYNTATRTSQLNFRTRNNGEWSAIAPVPFAGTAARRLPQAVVDNTDGLWLFWLELAGSQWVLKYNRHDGTAWASTNGIAFPLDTGNEPRVNGAPFVIFHPTETTQRLWVFWAREEPTGAPNQTRWRIAYRVKSSLTVAASDWSVIRMLPGGPAESQDREPAALVGTDGNIELFWSSNRNTSWAIWHSFLNRTNQTFATVEPVAARPFALREPIAFAMPAATLLIYRSNESVVYTSTVYGATETVDQRYVGCTSVDTRNQTQIAARGKFDDFLTYTYDTGQGGKRTDADLYSRDTVGLFVPSGAQESTGTIPPRFTDALKQFLPIQVRLLFIREQA
jgi:phage tail-like protein